LRIREILEEQGGVDRLEALNILAHALSMRKEGIITSLEREVGEIAAERIHQLFAERKKGRPFAYIARCKEFYSETFYVDERVLIPRPETELLVEEALELLKTRPEIKSILDMGTGSGAIGIVLAKETHRNIVCADISMDALRVAHRNKEVLGVSGNVHLLCTDLFAALGNIRFDMILANLPYVDPEEWDSLMTDVKDYEPRTALDGGLGGTAIYRRFVEGLPRHLEEKGYVLCEVGGREQANLIMDMFGDIGLNSITKKDLSGNERVLIGSWKNLS